MTYLATAPAHCPTCGRVLFTGRDGLWPYHYRQIERQVWCVASGTVAPEVRVRAVIG